MVTPAGLASFTTVATPAASEAWTGLRWRRLAPDAEVGLVRQVVPWPGGWLAVGEALNRPGAEATPLWLSTDGHTWDPVSLAAPAGSAIVSAAQIDGTLVAVTLVVVSERCSTEPPATCSDFSGPLRVWSSDDGRRWTERQLPIVVHPDMTFDRFTVPRIVVAEGAFVVMSDETKRSVAASADGIRWEGVTLADPIGGPPLEPRNVGRLGSNLIAIGDVFEDETLAATVWASSDGAAWAPTLLPSTWADFGTVGMWLEVAADGVLAIGATAGAGGPELWWASDGGPWTALEDFPPVGTWFGEAAGSGGVADGFVVGDGQHLVGYRGGQSPAAWRSSDALHWTPLTLGDAAPNVGNGGYPRGRLILTAIGLLFLAANGNVWLGEPITG